MEQIQIQIHDVPTNQSRKRTQYVKSVLRVSSCDMYN